MPDQVRQVAAREQRSKLSDFALLLFESTTNDGLKSMVLDDRLSSWGDGLSEDLRAFARWELEFREAFNIYVDLDPCGQIRRTPFETEAQARELLAREEHEREEARRSASEWRARMKAAIGL